MFLKNLSGGGLREQINKNAYENLEKNQKQVPIAVKDQSAPTERFDSKMIFYSILQCKLLV